MRDLIIVSGPFNATLSASLSSRLRAKNIAADKLRSSKEHISGREVLLIYSLAPPVRKSILEFAETAVLAANIARRLVVAAPYIGAKKTNEYSEFKLVASTLDAVGADYLVLVDPYPEEIMEFKTPAVAASAYPSIANKILETRRGEDLLVVTLEKLENRGEAFAQLLEAQLVLAKSVDELGKALLEAKNRNAILLWDRIDSCSELLELLDLKPGYLAAPHIYCQEESVEADKVYTSDSVDNAYSKVTLADTLASTIIAI